MNRKDKLMAMGMITGAAEKVLWAKKASAGNIDAIEYIAKNRQTIGGMLSAAITRMYNAVEIMAKAK